MMIVYAVVDDALSPDFPLGVDLEVFIRREDAERFIEQVGGDDPDLASCLRIEERELEAGGLNWRRSAALHSLPTRHGVRQPGQLSDRVPLDVDDPRPSAVVFEDDESAPIG